MTEPQTGKTNDVDRNAGHNEQAAESRQTADRSKRPQQYLTFTDHATRGNHEDRLQRFFGRRNQGRNSPSLSTQS
ncbi:MAG: hypothetical protein K2X27_05030 [Candidatus Obscuribacterales bacterium]|nr:hypothetical protein [Candidatus Obscuribacterales bacterium]